MSRTRHEIIGTLRTLSPTHVGSGDTRAVSSVKGKDGAEQPPEVAAIVRDAAGRPYLPATALKGLLRRLAEAHAGAAEVAALFGEIKADGGGNIGALSARGAEFVGASETPLAPYASRDELGPGVFVAARARIEPGPGTAKDGALFFQEMVAPGAEFAFRLLIETRGAEAEARADAALSALLPALDRLAGEDGASIGKGQADGFGRVRLSDVKIAKSKLGPDGEMKTVKREALKVGREPSARAEGARALRLTCDGPVAVIDASKSEKKGKRAQDDHAPQLSAQRLDERLPLILGSSVSGALRARARWIEALERHKNNVDAAPDEETIVAGIADVGKLSSVQRLFGVTGFRGLLSIEGLTVEKAEPWNVTSVKLDRFSGAPIDNALFTTATFIGVRMDLALRLDERRKPSEVDKALFERLLDDLKTDGLQIGCGGNKGFGWFTVEEVEHGR